jgi:VanZ family protein
VTRLFQPAIALAFVLVLAALLAISLAPPGTPLGQVALWPGDKVSHIAAFYGLTALSMAVFPRLHLVLLCLALSLLGAGIEYGQGLVGREVSLQDMIANFIGMLIALLPVAMHSLRLALHGRRASKARL